MKKNQIIIATLLILVVFFAGFFLAKFTTKDSVSEITNTGFSPNPAYEYLVGAAAWQMSAEAHALMIQGFNIAKNNLEKMIDNANNNILGYSWELVDGSKKLCKNGKPTAVICDIDDTLVDGVHYTANILGANGEWTNKAFVDFAQSDACTPLPGAIDFTWFCVNNGVKVFYVTNRYDQAYKKSQSQYNGEEGYKAPDGSVIGSSVHDVFGKTFYEITLESLDKMGFPVQNGKTNNCKDAILVLNDTKLKGSNKEPVRNKIANGGTLSTGQREIESSLYNSEINIDSHFIALLLGDDLNDIDFVFSNENANAISRIDSVIENNEKWGTKWIVFPNAVYGSSMNYAMKYGINDLFKKMDYTNAESDVWSRYYAK